MLEFICINSIRLIHVCWSYKFYKSNVPFFRVGGSIIYATMILLCCKYFKIVVICDQLTSWIEWKRKDAVAWCLANNSPFSFTNITMPSFGYALNFWSKKVGSKMLMKLSLAQNVFCIVCVNSIKTLFDQTWKQSYKRKRTNYALLVR